MIIDFTSNFNNYNNKVLNNYNVFQYTCPKCGAKHCFTRHGCYERSICFIDNNGGIKESRLDILRLKCGSCGSTHAIFPCDIIPYCFYSCSFILRALTDYFQRERKLLDICIFYNISFQVLYQFISRLLTFADSCKIALRNLGELAPSTLSSLVFSINNVSLDNSFSYQYFFQFQWIFLMKKFHFSFPCKIYVGAFVKNSSSTT